MALNGRYLRSFVMLTVALALGAGCSKKKKPEDEVVDPNAGLEPGALGTDLAAQAAENLRAVYFALDKYTLSGEAKNILQSNASWLKENPTVVIQVEGHCDERGSIEYNLALGEKRARSVKTYLGSLGLDDSRLTIISYGEERPVDPASTDSAWSKNRRSEFVVVSQ